MTVLDETPLDTPLSAAIREGSLAEHQAAEDSGFMTALMGGAVNERGYTDYLLRLRPVYATLEEVVREHLDHPAVAAVHDEALDRLDTLDRDLDYWCQDEVRTVDSPAADAYCARVRAAAAEWSPYLVAHHYTRYLGDLSGGLAIGRVISRSYDLDGQGIAFYAFPGIEKPKPYKDGYRARLDALDLDAEERERLIAEVKVAFHLNQAVFRELADNLDAYAR